MQLERINSEPQNKNCGIPQGLTHGPKLFIIYINDLCYVFNNLKIISFKDDTTIFFSDNDINVLGERV